MANDADIHNIEEKLIQAQNGLVNGDTGPWLDMFAEDGAMEFPFGPDGYPKRVGPKSELIKYFKDFPENLSFKEITKPTLYFTTDPNVVLAEFSCEGTALKTGNPYNQTYISVITLRDGEIINYRDYWNPLVALTAIGGLEALESFGHGSTSE